MWISYLTSFRFRRTVRSMKTIIYIAVTCFVSVVFTLHIAVPDTEPQVSAHNERYYTEIIKACEGTLAVYQSRYGDI